jgi:hypothetical protein
MAALGKITSTARNKSSADVLDKHPDSFSQPDPTAHKPRLVKRDGASSLINNRSYYNPPRKAKPPSAKQSDVQPTVVDENKKKEDEQSALRLVKKTKNKLEIKRSFHLMEIDICFYLYTVFDVYGKFISSNKPLIVEKTCMIIQVTFVVTNFFHDYQTFSFLFYFICFILSQRTIK